MVGACLYVYSKFIFFFFWIFLGLFLKLDKKICTGRCFSSESSVSYTMNDPPINHHFLFQRQVSFLDIF